MHGNIELLLSGSSLWLPNRTLRDGFHYRKLLKTTFRADPCGMKHLEISVTSIGMGLVYSLQMCPKMDEDEQGTATSSPPFCLVTFPGSWEVRGITILTEESRGQSLTATIFHPPTEMPKASWI